MAMISSLIDLADHWCALTGRSRSRLSTLALNDGKALDRLAAGGDLQTRSYEKTLLWLSENWPEGQPWPDGVDRPERARAAS